MIPVAGPWITETEVAAVLRACQNEWYDKANDSLIAFENAFAERHGRRFALATNSCTSAMFLGLKALGLGSGDEIILADANWIASLSPALHLGCRPVLVDINPNTWCIDESQIEPALTEKTRAVIAVNLYGGMPDYLKLQDICERNNVILIEDAAESLGSTFRGRPAGSFGDCSVFSFHGSKTLTTGEGGMLLTDDEALFQTALTLRNHGRTPGETDFRTENLGYKMPMSNLQAALGLAQLNRLPELVEKKREIFEHYEEALKNCLGIQLNPSLNDVENSYWMTTIVGDGTVDWTTKELRCAMKHMGFDSRPFFPPLSDLAAVQPFLDTVDYAKKNPLSYQYAGQGVNLPSALNMTDSLIQTVSKALSRYFESRDRQVS